MCYIPKDVPDENDKIGVVVGPSSSSSIMTTSPRPTPLQDNYYYGQITATKELNVPYPYQVIASKKYEGRFFFYNTESKCCSWSLEPSVLMVGTSQITAATAPQSSMCSPASLSMTHPDDNQHRELSQQADYEGLPLTFTVPTVSLSASSTLSMCTVADIRYNSSSSIRSDENTSRSIPIGEDDGDDSTDIHFPKAFMKKDQRRSKHKEEQPQQSAAGAAAEAIITGLSLPSEPKATSSESSSSSSFFSLRLPSISKRGIDPYKRPTLSSNSKSAPAAKEEEEEEVTIDSTHSQVSTTTYRFFNITQNYTPST
jgi:hypothetical protein